MSPKKVGGRKKLTARVTLQHSVSSIEDITEDTPTLVALQAVEDEMEQEKSPPAKKLKVSKVTWDKIENEVDEEEMEKYPPAKKELKLDVIHDATKTAIVRPKVVRDEGLTDLAGTSLEN